jgi:hypothetical protein
VWTGQLPGAMPGWSLVIRSPAGQAFRCQGLEQQYHPNFGSRITGTQPRP